MVMAPVDIISEYLALSNQLMRDLHVAIHDKDMSKACDILRDFENERIWCMEELNLENVKIKVVTKEQVDELIKTRDTRFGKFHIY